jgi:hypothetical protein
MALQETPQQRAADALVDILDAAHAVEHGQTKTTHIPAGAAQVQVLIPYQDLLDRTAASGLLTDGTPISAGELRLLACGAELIPVVLGSESQVLDMGHTIRLAPPPLRRAIGLRDGGCAFPSCSTPVRHCDMHHIRPWQEGGPTDRDNIVALCRVHHALCEPRPPTTGPDGIPWSKTAGTSASTTADYPSSSHPRQPTPPEHRSDASATQPPCSTTTNTRERGDAMSE